jgi:zinc transport system substrate-binding protein
LNGAHLEPWKENILQIINTKMTRVVTMSDGLTEANDPHFWLSPKLMKNMAEKISKTMQEADGLHASYYAQNEAVLQQKLSILDEEFTAGLLSCAKRDIVTSHNAFGYLANSYNLRQTPIAGLSPDAEPSPKQLADLSAFVKQNGIKYIFFESLTSPKLSQTLAKETGTQTLVLNPIEGLTPDEVTAGKDYMSEMRNNLKNLQIALECK